VAAQPIKRQLLADIDAAGGWDAIWERVASGESQTAIARSFGVSQGFFSRVIHLDDARARDFRGAKRLAATEYAEEAKDIVDNAPLDRDAISKAREQASVRRWLASCFDRDQFGEAAPDVNVTVNTIEHLHLDALRHRMVETPRPLGLPRGTDDDDGEDAVPTLTGPDDAR